MQNSRKCKLIKYLPQEITISGDNCIGRAKGQEIAIYCHKVKDIEQRNIATNSSTGSSSDATGNVNITTADRLNNTDITSDLEISATK